MTILLWIAQIFLAFTFLYSGICKSVFSEEQLIKMGQTGVAGFPKAALRFIGISEILGSIGIIVPWWTGILPVLTPVSAICFGFIMILAARIHHKLKEPRNVAINISFLALSIFVAWGRLLQL